MSARLSPGQKLALLLAAAIDNRLSPLQRACASSAAEAIEARRAPAPGLLAGPFLTEAGRAAALALLPAEPGPAVFPHVVDDILRRLRAGGRPCSSVVLEPLPEPSSWRLSWAGEGWADFALVGQGRRPEARETREELACCAVALGLELAEEGTTWIRFAPPRVAPISVLTEDDDLVGVLSAEDEDEDHDDGPRPWRSPTLQALRAEAEEREPRLTIQDRLDRLERWTPPRARTLDELIAGLEGVPYVPAPSDAPLLSASQPPRDPADLFF